MRSACFSIHCATSVKCAAAFESIRIVDSTFIWYSENTATSVVQYATCCATATVCSRFVCTQALAKPFFPHWTQVGYVRVCSSGHRMENVIFQMERNNLYAIRLDPNSITREFSALRPHNAKSHVLPTTTIENEKDTIYVVCELVALIQSSCYNWHRRNAHIDMQYAIQITINSLSLL